MTDPSGRRAVAARGLVERAWRCSQCGKWSHAITRPVSHRRFVRTSDGLPADAKVLSVVEAMYDHMNGFTQEGGWFIVCGPFDTYEVRMVEPDETRTERL